MQPDSPAGLIFSLLPVTVKMIFNVHVSALALPAINEWIDCTYVD